MPTFKLLIILTFSIYGHGLFAQFSGTQDPELRFGSPAYANLLESMMVLNSYGVPLSPIKKGLKELTVTPARISASVQGVSTDNLQNPADTLESRSTSSNFSYLNYKENESSGFAGIISYFHAVGDKWGYAVNFSHVRLTGSLFAMAEYGGDSDPTLENKFLAEEEGDSTQLMAYVIYDPFAGSEKSYSLPLFLGMGFYDSFQKATGSFAINTTTNGSTTVSYSAEIDTISVGFLVGGSFQFNTGKIRWSPFILGFIPLETPQYFINATTSNGTVIINEERQDDGGDSILLSGGLAVAYEPWGISLRWTPNLFSVGDELFGDDDGEDYSQSVVTLSKTWIWNK